MKKVIVSREVAEAIEGLLKSSFYDTKEDILTAHARMSDLVKHNWAEPYDVLNHVPLLQLAQILINGYEVELTPEEEIKKMYVNCRLSHDEDDDTYARGILYALNTLGIKIKGIND